MSADIIQFIPRSNPKPVTINIYPDISPLECMAIDIVNEIFPSGDSVIMDTRNYPDPPLAEYVASAGYDSAPAEYNYQAPADDPA